MPKGWPLVNTFLLSNGGNTSLQNNTLLWDQNAQIKSVERSHFNFVFIIDNLRSLYIHIYAVPRYMLQVSLYPSMWKVPCKLFNPNAKFSCVCFFLIFSCQESQIGLFNHKEQKHERELKQWCTWEDLWRISCPPQRMYLFMWYVFCGIKWIFNWIWDQARWLNSHLQSATVFHQCLRG